MFHKFNKYRTIKHYDRTFLSLMDIGFDRWHLASIYSIQCLNKDPWEVYTLWIIQQLGYWLIFNGKNRWFNEQMRSGNEQFSRSV